MEVLIDGKLYKPKDHAIAVKLNDKDKENIKNMPEDNHVYLTFPNSLTEEETKSLIENIKKQLARE